MQDSHMQNDLRNPERFERYLQEHCFVGWQFDDICIYLCVSGRLIVMSDDVAQKGSKRYFIHSFNEIQVVVYNYL